MPLAAVTSPCSRRDRGAEPDTQSRRPPRRPTRSDPTNRWYMVGTPKKRVTAWSSRGPGHDGRIEAGQEDRRRPGQQGAVDADAQAVGVEDRQAVDQAVLGGPPPRRGHRLRGGQKVPVREHCTLGDAGGPRGEADQGGIVGCRLVDRPRVTVGEVQVRPGHHDRPGRGPPHPLGLVGPVDDGRGSPGVGDDVRQLPLRVRRVGRYHHQAGAQRPDVGHQGRHRRPGRPHHPVPR